MFDRKRYVSLLATMLIVATLAYGTPVRAGPYSDTLAKCLVSSTVNADQEILVRWIVLAYASHPAASSLVSIDTSRIRDVQMDMAAFTERLFLNDCLLEAREAARYEGEFAIVSAFKSLASSAGRVLLNDEKVQEMFSQYVSFFDEERFEREIFGR